MMHWNAIRVLTWGFPRSAPLVEPRRKDTTTCKGTVMEPLDPRTYTANVFPPAGPNRRVRGHTMSSLALEIGRALRRTRLALGLTLRDVAALSSGRFKATSVAGYERGERNITLER